MAKALPVISIIEKNGHPFLRININVAFSIHPAKKDVARRNCVCKY
jgi:hypothetical protein